MPHRTNETEVQRKEVLCRKILSYLEAELKAKTLFVCLLGQCPFLHVVFVFAPFEVGVIVMMMDYRIAHIPCILVY